MSALDVTGLQQFYHSSSPTHSTKYFHDGQGNVFYIVECTLEYPEGYIHSGKIEDPARAKELLKELGGIEVVA